MTSSSFTITDSTAYVKSTAYVRDYDGNILPEYNSKRYDIEIFGASSASFSPVVGATTGKAIDFVDGGSYRITIRNPIDLRNVDAYLTGYDSITPYN